MWEDQFAIIKGLLARKKQQSNTVAVVKLKKLKLKSPQPPSKLAVTRN
jgi:hypothetical protein